MTMSEMMRACNLKDRNHFREPYFIAALNDGAIERKPSSGRVLDKLKGLKLKFRLPALLLLRMSGYLQTCLVKGCEIYVKKHYICVTGTYRVSMESCSLWRCKNGL